MGIAFTDEQMRNWIQNKCEVWVEVEHFTACNDAAAERYDLILHFTPFPPEAIAWMKAHENCGSRHHPNWKWSGKQIMMIPFYYGHRYTCPNSNKSVTCGSNISKVHFPLLCDGQEIDITGQGDIHWHNSAIDKWEDENTCGTVTQNRLRPSCKKLPIKAAQNGNYRFYGFFDPAPTDEFYTKKQGLAYWKLTRSFKYKRFGFWLGLYNDFHEWIPGKYSNTVRRCYNAETGKYDIFKIQDLVTDN